MGLFNALGVFMAALSLVLLAKHGFDMGTFSGPSTSRSPITRT